MALVKAKVSIEGVQPLLWHHFGPDAIPLGAKEKSGKAGNDPDEWRKTVLATESGQLYLRREYVFGCLRAAAKFTTRKRGTLQPYVAATLQVLQDTVLIDRWMPKGGPAIGAETEAVYLDRRAVVNPGTKRRNVRYRVAVSPGWKAEFLMTWDNTVVGREEMEAVAHDGGKLVGLGSGRDIGFGRFVVKSFEVDHAQEPATARDLGKNTTKRVAKGSKKVRTLPPAGRAQRVSR